MGAEPLEECGVGPVGGGLAALQEAGRAEDEAPLQTEVTVWAVSARHVRAEDPSLLQLHRRSPRTRPKAASPQLRGVVQTQQHHGRDPGALQAVHPPVAFGFGARVAEIAVRRG